MKKKLKSNIKIAAWSGPRNISTALMRSFGSRTDTFVSDEPLYAYYLITNKINHPMKNTIINNMEINLSKIITYLINDIPNEKSIWYQKHMAHHLPLNSNLDWIKNFLNILLIRNPNDVILSYIKKNNLNNIFQLGLPQQKKILLFLKKNNIDYFIINTNELLKNPKQILFQLCNKIGVPFTEKMLTWEKGPKNYDGIWGEYWYKNMYNSTEFKKNKEKTTNIKIPKTYLPIYNQAIEYYNFLKEDKNEK